MSTRCWTRWRRSASPTSTCRSPATRSGPRSTGPGRREVTATRPEASGDGRPYALATVVRVDPPVSARVGDKAVVTAEGVLSGWVGGACSEPIVIREALAALAEGHPRLVRITPAEMQAAVADEPAAVELPGVVAAVSTCPSGGGLEVFVEPVGVAPRLLVAGATPVARTLAKLAEA